MLPADNTKQPACILSSPARPKMSPSGVRKNGVQDSHIHLQVAVHATSYHKSLPCHVAGIIGHQVCHCCCNILRGTQPLQLCGLYLCSLLQTSDTKRFKACWPASAQHSMAAHVPAHPMLSYGTISFTACMPVALAGGCYCYLLIAVLLASSSASPITSAV